VGPRPTIYCTVDISGPTLARYFVCCPIALIDHKGLVVFENNGGSAALTLLFIIPLTEIDNLVVNKSRLVVGAVFTLIFHISIDIAILRVPILEQFSAIGTSSQRFLNKFGTEAREGRILTKRETDKHVLDQGNSLID